MLLSYAIFALMLIHQAHRPVLIGLLLVSIAAGALRRPAISFSRPPLLILAVGAPFAIWYFVNALAPEVQADPNVYHLQPAQDALRHGGFSGNISFYERLPHALEMLFIPAWMIGGGSGAKLVHFAFLIATLPVIVHLARAFNLPRMAGHIAAAFYFVTPVAGVTGASAFNDAALVYFTLAAVALALEGRAIHAGLTAGFCYAVKMTGLLAVPVAMLIFFARKQWKPALLCGIAAAATCSPWMIRNLVDTGNPFAPFFNRWFPNPYFYVLTEQNLALNLRSYGVSLQERFPELLAGYRLHGIIGPAFMIAPVFLFAIRRRAGAVLIGLTLAFSIPWWMNAGARFLMPALPFLTLALCVALPARLAAAFLLLHAITSLPPLVHFYTPKALQLHAFPWQAALRIESEHDYLTRVSGDYRYVKFAEQNTPPDARILDLIGAHRAHTDREFIGVWSTSLGIRSLEAMEFARPQGANPLKITEARFGPASICGFRLMQTADTPELWNVHSLELRSQGNPIQNRRGWTLSSPVNRWELPLAFDRNPVSHWSTWQAAEPGMFLQVDLATPVIADAVHILSPAAARTINVEVEICRNGQWQRVTSKSLGAPELNLRPAATEMMRKAGITHILAPAAYQGIGVLGERLANEPEHWNLELIASRDTVYLLKTK